MKEIDPNKYNVTESGQVLKSLSSEQYAEQKKAFDDAIKICNPEMIKYDGHEYEAIKDGVKYKSTDGKNWVLAPEHQNCKAGYVLADHEYNKIQNYIEAIRLIAEKVKTSESDCIEQLARDVGNYLYDLAKGEKDNG